MYPAPAYPRATRSWLSWATSAPRMPSVSSRQAGTLPYSRYVGTPLFVRYRTWPCRTIRPAEAGTFAGGRPGPGTHGISFTAIPLLVVQRGGSITLSRCLAGPPRAGQWNPYACGQHLRAFAHLVIDLRRIRVEAMHMDQIETPTRRTIGGVGPVRHPMGAHAPGECQHGSQIPLRLGLGHLAAIGEQVCAGSLGRLVLGTADPELLRVDLGQPARQLVAAVGVGVLRHPVGAHTGRVGESLLGVR